MPLLAAFQPSGQSSLLALLELWHMPRRSLHQQPPPWLDGVFEDNLAILDVFTRQAMASKLRRH